MDWLFVTGLHSIVRGWDDSVRTRHPVEDVHVHDALLAQRHFARDELMQRTSPARVTIEDLGSKNGTYVRGQRLSAPTVRLNALPSSKESKRTTCSSNSIPASRSSTPGRIDHDE